MTQYKGAHVFSVGNFGLITCSIYFPEHHQEQALSIEAGVALKYHSYHLRTKKEEVTSHDKIDGGGSTEVKVYVLVYPAWF